MIKVIEALADAFQIAKKDIIEFVRDRARLVTFVVMPIFMMTMMGYIFPSQTSLRNVPLGIVNQDKGKVSDTLIQMLEKLKSEKDRDKRAFHLKPYANTEKAKEGIKNQDVNGVIVFEKNLTEKITLGKQVNIILITDQSNPQVSSMLSVVLNQIVEKISTSFGEQKVEKILTVASLTKGIPSILSQEQKLPETLQPEPKAIVKPLVLKSRGVVPGKPNYFEFMAPGIMGMVVIMAVMMGLAGSVSRENELGTLDGILVAPIPRFSIVFGKTLAQTARGLTQGTLVLILAIFLFDVRIYGNPLLVAILLILGIFSFIGLGILVSAAATEQETAMMVLMTLTFPMYFLSGAFFPIQQMPEFMQVIARLLPMTYMVEALRKVIVLGAGISALRTDIAVLLSFGLVTLTIAIPIFNKVITR